MFFKWVKIMERFNRNLHLIIRGLFTKGDLYLNKSEEEAIIHRCQVGDKEAFRKLVEQHKSVLFGTAYLMTRDSGLAEDAVQGALVQMWKNLPRLRLRGSLKSWLVRILINEVKQQARKKRIPTVPLEQDSYHVDCLAEAETEVMRHEERQILKQALECLPPEQREIVVLHYYSDLTVPEVAAIMGKHTGTIKSRLSRALDRLGEILKEKDMWGERR
jgi:RNA polymerase sigma-70 factor, ECF subfamily